MPGAIIALPITAHCVRKLEAACIDCTGRAGGVRFPFT